MTDDSDENALLFSHINDATARRFRLFRKGEPWKTVPYQVKNHVESFGAVRGDRFYSYVNDATSRKFEIYRDGVLWKTVAYNSANHVETFGMVMPNSTFTDYGFYSYVNDASRREFRLFENGKLWKRVSYNPSNAAEGFGQIGGLSAHNTVHGHFYSVVNDVTSRQIRIYRDSALWKSVNYQSSNAAEFFTSVTSKNRVVSFVNDQSRRKFFLYRDGVPWKEVPYSDGNAVEELSVVFDY